ncbi:hypothetical protein ABID22_002054 [Pontibacter aydingkolensis]|uniref:Polysaccharide (De)acetylase n=1 Tax=Pontibacter aydingkolensis TaxID=1911536 RepID=A0ABS7CV48_9BACT|nr:hypothetical protein [Pontibacter aydingkolensis]MBW7467670.1 hypothetical protein [Pontibacter aydingkolensis]
MFSKIKRSVSKNISNIPGWSTSRKIIVFLVDDWGAVRIRNKAAWNALKNAGIDVESSRFNRYDTLAGCDDLTSLFDILARVKDRTNRSAVFTAVAAVANPDFAKIRASDFQQYHYEAFTTTLQRYFSTNQASLLWQQGIDQRLFVPEFHGREHLNVKFWFKSLMTGDKNIRTAFDYESIGIKASGKSDYKNGYMAAYDFESKEDIPELVKLSEKGIDIFKESFNYSPSLLVAPSLLHNSAIEPALAKKGIKFIDRAKVSLEPQGNAKYKKKHFYLGEKNKHGQLYFTRNCLFEPTHQADSVNMAMGDISIAFRWNKPAIISSHRVNFVGGLDEANRKIGLNKLEELLNRIIDKWPEVEFMTASELGEIMLEGGR